MKSLGSEIGLMFLVALVAVGLVEVRPMTLSGPPPPVPTEAIEEKAQPYETYPDMLMVAFTLSRTQQPSIDKVQLLTQGRVSTPLAGDYRLKLVGADGRILYSLPFAVDFFLLDGPSDPLDQMSYTFVLPYTPEVTKVVLSTPQGEVIYDLPEGINS